jgi:hypothetical protein
VAAADSRGATGVNPVFPAVQVKGIERQHQHRATFQAP